MRRNSLFYERPLADREFSLPGAHFASSAGIIVSAALSLAIMLWLSSSDGQLSYRDISFLP
jgi:high-affinity Fe2+/Pb2+ permease